MDVEFVIPVKKEDLLNKADGQYVVERVLNVSEALEQVKGVKRALSIEGCGAILNNFDTLYSILYDSKEVQFRHLQELFDAIIYKMLEKSYSYAEEALSTENAASGVLRQTNNVLKMVYYIYFMHLRAYEEKLASKTENMIAEPKRGKGIKKAKSSADDDESWNWNEKKKSALVSIYPFLQLEISRLWDPPVVEEQFVNLIANCCYKMIENPEINKFKPLKDSAAQILAVLITKYNHGFTLISKLVQLMKQFEHTGSTLSNAVLIMVIDYKCNTLMAKLLKELCDSIRDEDSANLTKAGTTFIMDIAEKHPQSFYPSVKILRSYLSCDPYLLRIAVLVTFAEILLHCFPKDSSQEDSRKVRNMLVQALERNFRDQNSYVRSKVVQLWIKLVDSEAIPKDSFLPMLQTAKYHITDKSCYVSKYTIHLFRSVLLNNIYTGKRCIQLNIKELQENLEKQLLLLESMPSKRSFNPEESWKSIEPELILYLTKTLQGEVVESQQNDQESQDVAIDDVIMIIQKLMKEKCYEDAYTLLKTAELQFPNANEIRCNIDKADLVEYYRNVMKKIFLTAPDVPTQKVEKEFHCKDYEDQKSKVNYFKDCITFTELLNEVAEKAYTIMLSKSSLEVLEAIDFFTVADKYGISNAKKVTVKMLLLVRSQQQPIKEAVAAAYRTLYLTVDDTYSSKECVKQVVKKMLGLVKGLNHDQRSCLEVLMRSWIEQDLDKEFVMVLWDIFLRKQKSHSEDSLAALILLNMIANVQASLILCNIPYILDKLSEISARSSSIKKRAVLEEVGYMCKIITKLAATKKDGKYVRYPSNHQIFKDAINIAVNCFAVSSTIQYMNMAVAIIDMVFELCFKPENMMYILLEDLFLKSQALTPNKSGDNENIGANKAMFIAEEWLINLLTVFTHIIYRTWKYFDREVFNNVKRCKDGVATLKQNTSLEDEFEADNEVAADDALYETISSLCDTKILAEKTLSGYLKDIVLKICKGHFGNTSPRLKIVAATAMIRLLMVSQSCCEDNVQLYVTIMEKSPVEAVRGNLVMGFGDLTCRFPNVIEPWTPYLYGKLKDPSVLVRRNTVSVLTHLITREMVKVRGQIAELVLCIEDPDPMISEEVKFLLFDLSKKGNTLYNVMVDIISRLSSPDRTDQVSMESFKNILSYTFSLVTKERQNEVLVEKLCARLRESSNDQQCECLAFCLMQLSYNDKSLRRLVDCLPTFTDKLLLQPVYSAIISILNTAQKSTKPNVKEIASDAHDRLDELITQKESDEEGNADKPSSRPRSFVGSTPKISRSQQKGGSAQKSVRKSAHKTATRSKRNQANNYNSDSDSSPPATKTKRAGRGKRIIYEESNSDGSAD